MDIFEMFMDFFLYKKAMYILGVSGFVAAHEVFHPGLMLD